MEDKFVKLKSFSGKRILFVGVGNVLRSDDGIGVYIVKRIAPIESVTTLPVEVSLENYISVINRISPEVLVVIDCIDFKKRPGYFDLLPVKDITEKVINSHHITFSRISEFFKMPVFVLGIQPGSLKVGETLTASVKESGNRIISYVNAFYKVSVLNSLPTIH
jgi:hydrogenase 3 maturation protease